MTVLFRLGMVRNIARFLLLVPVFLAPASLMRFTAQAQSAKRVAEITHDLSPESQKVIERLSSFDSLPAEQWKYHSGDLAHGELSSLDDSNWALVKRGSTAPTDAVWYRRVVEVPKALNGYDLTGSRIWFKFQADANGPMPQIILLSLSASIKTRSKGPCFSSASFGSD